MKAFLVLIALGGACVALGGCESDLPPDTTKLNPGEKFERGVTGKGSLSVPDRSGDPLIREDTRVGN